MAKVEAAKNSVENNIGCWQSVLCYYDRFKIEPSDNYTGDIFGYLSQFESPHWLFRRFHKNYCKSLILASLSSYQLIEDDTESYNSMIDQIKDINNSYFSIEQLARHHSLVLMIGSVEAFLKDSFITILKHIHPEKIGNNDFNKILRKYNFQNIESQKKAFNWLIPNFNSAKLYQMRDPIDFFKIIDLTEMLAEMLERRHKIVHESHYYDDLDEKLFSFYTMFCFEWASNFNHFFIDNGYYEKMDSKYDQIFKK